LTLQQIEEALGDENMFYASHFYGREPTPMEAIHYWISHQPKVRTFDVVPNLFTQTQTLVGMGNED